MKSAMDNAAHRVFGISELREIILNFAIPTSHTVFAEPGLFIRILAYVAPRDLLLNCYLVCKQWHTQLHASRLLFFTPHAYIYDKPPIPWDPDDPASPLNNPNDPSGKDYLLNPFFQLGFPGWLDNIADAKLTQSSFLQLPWLKSETATQAWRRKDASWRRMQLTQPPTIWLQFHSLYPHWHIFDGLRICDGLVPETSTSLEFGAGIVGFTLAHLYDYLDATILHGEHDSRPAGMENMRPEVETWVYRQAWEGGECGVNINLAFFLQEGDEGVEEGRDGDERWESVTGRLRSEDFEELEVQMSLEYLPPPRT